MSSPPAPGFFPNWIHGRRRSQVVPTWSQIPCSQVIRRELFSLKCKSGLRISWLVPTAFPTWCFIKIRVCYTSFPVLTFPSHPSWHAVSFPWVSQLTTYGGEKKGIMVFFCLSFEITVLCMALHFIQNPPLGYLAIKRSLISRLMEGLFPTDQHFLLFLPGLWATRSHWKRKAWGFSCQFSPKWEEK